MMKSLSNISFSMTHSLQTSNQKSQNIQSNPKNFNYKPYAMLFFVTFTVLAIAVVVKQNGGKDVVKEKIKTFSQNTKEKAKSYWTNFKNAISDLINEKEAVSTQNNNNKEEETEEEDNNEEEQNDSTKTKNKKKVKVGQKTENLPQEENKKEKALYIRFDDQSDNDLYYFVNGKHATVLGADGVMNKDCIINLLDHELLLNPGVTKDSDNKEKDVTEDEHVHMIMNFLQSVISSKNNKSVSDKNREKFFEDFSNITNTTNLKNHMDNLKTFFNDCVSDSSSTDQSK